MKLIFLDVDGVLNRDTTEQHFEDDCLGALKYLVDKTGARIVLSSTWRYTEETRESVRAKLKEKGIMAPEDDFLGYTPHLGMIEKIPMYPSCDSHVTRTDEIFLWLQCNTVPEGSTREQLKNDPAESSYCPLPSVALSFEDLLTKGETLSAVGTWILSEPILLDSFVVLDDLPMLTEGCYGKLLKKNFIRTSMQVGLTQDLADEAAKILNARFNVKKWRKTTYRSCTNPNCLLSPNRPPNETGASGRQRTSTQGGRDPQKECLIS